MNKKPTFLFLAVAFLTISCSSKKESTTPKVQDITASVYASGLIKSENQYKVFGRVNGIITKVYTTEGSIIKKGHPIFQLESKDLQLTTDNARIASLTADYNRNKDKLNDAQKAIEIAQKQLTNDSLLYHRQKKPLEQ